MTAADGVIAIIKAKLMSHPAVQAVETLVVFHVTTTLKPDATREDRDAVYQIEKSILASTHVPLDFYVQQ
jgi:hypothetical protein